MPQEGQDMCKNFILPPHELVQDPENLLTGKLLMSIM